MKLNKHCYNNRVGNPSFSDSRQIIIEYSKSMHEVEEEVKCTKNITH